MRYGNRARIDAASLFKADEVQDFDVHPDGRTAICSVNRGGNWELARLNLSDRTLRRFLSGDQSLQCPVHSPSGELIAYQADFEGDEDFDVFVVGANGKGVRKLTDGVADNEHPEFSPDGSRIAFISNRVEDMENLYFVPASGGDPVRLTDEALPVRSFSWSPDGRRIAYGTGISDDDYISVVDLQKRRTRKVLAKRGVDYGISDGYGDKAFQWSADGRSIMFTSNENDSYDIGVLDLASRKRRWLIRSPRDKYSPQWSPDGTRISYLEVVEPDLVLMVAGSDGKRVVSQSEGVSRSHRWLPDGSGMAFINGSSVRPEELYIVKGSKPRRISNLTKGKLPTREFARPTVVRYRSFDGRKVSAMLFVPRTRRSGRGVVIPHGGPEMQSLNFWDQIVQMLVMKDFTVILPNYRGSTGYGREFLHLHDRDLGGGDLKDTVRAGEYLINSRRVDRDKLGFWGASYGGYLCMMALTKAPEMWAAGVSIVGFFDWVTEFENERGYLKAYDRVKMGDPEKDRDRYFEQSPINFIADLRAPLLMTASSQDVRCPPTESRALVRKLEALGKDFEYHEYTDEGHWPRKRKNLRDLYERSVDFLDRMIPS